LIVLLLTFSVFAFKQNPPSNTLEPLVVIKPQLRVVETHEDFRFVRDDLPTKAAIEKFLAENGEKWRVVLDLRRGVPSLIDGGAIPFIPGKGNNLSWNTVASNCSSIQCIPKSEIESRAREFLTKYSSLFPVSLDDLRLDTEGTTPVGESIYLVRFQWYYSGIPVEKGSIFMIINNGNLIQIASSRIAPISLDTNPSFSVDTAWEIINGYLGKQKITEKDEIVNNGTLVIIPVTPDGYEPNSYVGPASKMAEFKLAYRIMFRKSGIMGTWEALVDAHSGEILRFVDANKYGKIQGGVYKTDKNPTQTEETVPFPYADYGTGVYSDIGGNYPGTSGTSTMKGRVGSIGNVGGVKINDNCGAISLSSNSEGLIDFGTSGGKDCTTPGFGGAGNTHSARTQYYNVSWIKIKAYTYLSGNSWLQNVVTDNVNINQACNAYWDGTSLNFFKSGTYGGYVCGNTGELPGVSLHEWGHGMDDNDGSGGDSPPVETRADWTAILQTHQSCAGGGFFLSSLGCGNPPSQGSGYYNCDGYGDCCLDCSGIRDADWDKHASHTPWTIANYGTVWSGCDSGYYYGPCGKEDHCESGIATQALWDLAVRDLPTYCGMDATSAWQLVDRLWYTSMPSMGDMYTCTPPTSDGCGGSSLFNLFRAIDDDGDGTANGTPHAQGIFQAFNRHNIACGNADDAANQNQTSCPTLTISTLTGSAGNNSVVLNWGEVANATRYFIFRNDTSCDSGFTKIATVNAPATTYTDTTATNGITSYYRIQAATNNDSCVSAMSNCVAVTPQPCAGTIRVDKNSYNCSSSISITVTDSTVSLPVNVEFWSTTDAAHKLTTLTDAGSANYVGTINTVTGSAGANEVQVSDGDTVYLRYTDPDYCGTPNVAVNATVLIDCVAPLISNVSVTNITGNSATITFETNEPATSSVYYDTNLPPLLNSVNTTTLQTSHSITLNNLTECTRYYFFVRATDYAGNSADDNNQGVYYTFKTLKNTNPTYTKVENPPLAIPDNDTTTGASSVISVQDDKIIQDVNVKINITHTFDADLDIYLIAPDNTTVELSTDNGGSGDNYIDTIFDDEATTPITSGTPPFTGTFKPEGNLSVLYGKNAQGNWTLKVYDDASADTGTINNWSIEFLYPQESCPESAGIVFFEKKLYGCLNDNLTIQVQDADLLGSGTTTVNVWSDLETTPETVTLNENPPSSGIFKGSIQTTNSVPVSGDGFVSTNGGLVYVRYIDANDGSGGSNIPREDSANIDCEGPVITNVTVTNITGSTATINWTTDVPSDSLVGYGTAIPPSMTTSNATLVTTHSVTITGLSPCTQYFFYVQSKDEFNNPTSDYNSSNYYTFETYGGGINTYSYAGAPVDIPDNNSNGVLVPINISDSGTITDVNVTININHTWDADLDIYLVHPDGTTVELSTDNGSSGDNYINTTFDDSASTPITNGTPPFTGTFRPEGSLATLNGKNINGVWNLLVKDDANGDTGSVQNYSLEISYSKPCGPALEYVSSVFTDSCKGAGNGGDGIIDPGEDVSLRVTLRNVGVSDATNVSAVITTTSPNATITDDTAQFPDISVGASAESLSPHFTIHISENASCGETIPVHLVATCNGTANRFEADLTLTVGNVVNNVTTLWSESFDDTTFPPTNWAQVDVSGTAGNWARATATVHPVGNPPHSGGGLAYFNSYSCSTGSSTRLFRSLADTIPSFASSSALSFYMYHDTGLSTKNDRIQAQVSTDGVNWVNVGNAVSRYDGSTGWKQHSIDLSSYIGQTIYIGLLGISAYGNDCHIDDVELSYIESSCLMTPCVVSCEPPTSPVVTVTDGNSCLQNGVYVDYTPGTPATRHDLYVDGSPVATDIYPNYFYNPGDSAQHSYVVRAINVNDTCYTDSAPVKAEDVNNSPTVAPVITNIVDVNPLSMGLVINYTPGFPADRHDLYKDGVLAVTNFVSGSMFYPGDSLIHTYKVAAVKGSCSLMSAGVIAQDRCSRIRPRRPEEPFPFDPLLPDIPIQ
jgi:subtilisin-like proprotein convertase family protein